MNRVLILLFAVTLVACTLHQRHKPIALITDSAMVVSAHPIASRIGTHILKKGGNAVTGRLLRNLRWRLCILAQEI